MFLTPPDYDPAQSGITAFNLRAAPLFERALWQGQVYRLRARVMRHSWRLLVLGDCLSADRIRSPQPSSVQAVDLSSIRGSIDRSDDFDDHFYPLHDRLATRWVRIASMLLQHTALPPIELIRVGGLYFVVDGHHRVSAARALHYVTVDALVTAAYD